MQSNSMETFGCVWSMCHHCFREHRLVAATLLPSGDTVVNGSDLNLTCTLHGQLNGKTAADIHWIACLKVNSDCGPISTSHRVEVTNSRTSILHLQDLRMPEEGGNEGMTYRCCFNCDGWNPNNYQTSATVYVGLPPFPVENLQCSSRNISNFTCSWDRGQYTGLGIRNTYVRYKERVSSGNWKTITLGRDIYSFTQKALMFEMEIHVVQENPLGNSSNTKILFSTLTETIPNPPTGLNLTFLQHGDFTTDMWLSWEIPNEWLEKHKNALLYKFYYKNGRTNETIIVELNRVESVERGYLIEKVEPYTNYMVRVACQLNSASFWSEWSPLVSGVSPEAAPSGRVVDLIQSVLGVNPNPYKRDVQLTWQPPRLDEQSGVIRGYHVNISSNSLPETLNVTVAENMYELPDIDKFHQYDVHIAAYTTKGAGPYSHLVIPDLTTEPAQVENLVANSDAPNRIVVAWAEPSNPHGEILKYVVKWNVASSPDNVHAAEPLDREKQKLIIDGLQPYTKYDIWVIIHNKVGKGQPVTDTVTTLFSVPTRPRNVRSHKSSSTEIELRWEPPETINGPFFGYEVHYWPSSDPQSSTNKSVSVTQAVLSVDCSMFEEAIPFMFKIFTVTGWNEEDKLLGEPVLLEKEMCGTDLPTTAIIIAVLISAFSILLLVFCFYTVRHSALMKPSPNPYFIDGILEPSSEKFKSRVTFHQDKEDFDVLNTCESFQELIIQESQVTSNKSSLSTSSGSSSDQGFHDMQSDAETYNQTLMNEHRRPNTRCSSGYGHSELDLEQGQRMLSPMEEYREDEVPVFSCPEDGDDCIVPVTSYMMQTADKESPLPSPEAVHIPMGSRESVQYTSRRASPVLGVSQSSSRSPHRLSSGSESDSMTYLQLGANHPASTSQNKVARQDKGEESDINYSQMAIQGTVSVQTPPYESVWPSESSPEELDSHPGAVNPDWINGFRTDLGFNNNSKEIPDIHSVSSFKAPQEVIVATALSPQTPNKSSSPEVDRPLLPKLSSTDSEDYIDIVGGNSSPRANPSQFSLPLMSPNSRNDASCMDYVLQSELPPASPQESTVL
ncbi:interleukin-6 receptor subunit beta-like isoform X2 [Acanthaster planci]|uniref:Interleukin-6 receptor subunit beta-like isoform X2 n=1 Tax=Acanthaster planci TaxID=133434 RepID=A0A8B7ZHU9_ACAPL|nr:interleukin-6 receptor subunit beta-like isoform X2 [Acanthaster planci]